MTTIDLMQQHHSMVMPCPTLYYTHPFYRQQQQQQHFHPMVGHPYRGESDFRPSFYNPFEIKHRRRTSRAQLKVLEKSFLENAKPNASVRRYLAQELDMTPRGVQIWFQNRRAKTKLQKRKSLQQQQQQQPVPNSPSYTTINDSNSFSMTSTHSSSTFDSVSPLFYPMGTDNSSLQANQEKPSTDSSFFMSDRSWLAMPMHPLCSSDNEKNVMQQQQNIATCGYLPSPTTPMSTKPNETIMTTMMTPWLDTSIYPSESSTPGWSLDTATTQYPSPLSDYHQPTLLDQYRTVQSSSSSSFGSYPMNPVSSSCSLDYQNY